MTVPKPLSLDVLENQTVARAHAAPLDLAGPQLDDRLRSAREGDPPRPERRHDLAHDELAVEEKGVDGEAHEEHVDGRRRPDEQALARLEPGATEQPLQPTERRRRDGAALADDRAILAYEPHEGRFRAGTHAWPSVFTGRKST
jgi:hypothetical protein